MASPLMDVGLCADEQFSKNIAAIEKRLQLLDRLPRVRVKAWLSKLKEKTSNITWKRNRNLYAKLLLEQLRAGCLEVPFNALPPEGGLPTLPAYLTYRFLSPPKQRPNTAGVDEHVAGSPLSRPCSAGAGSLDHQLYRQQPSPGAHSSWTVQGLPPLQLTDLPARTHPAAAVTGGVVAPRHLSALSPARYGSSPRQGYLPGQQQQLQLHYKLPATAAARPRRSSSNSPGKYRKAADKLASSHGVSHGSWGGSKQLGASAGAGGLLLQNPGSPGAAQLLDAAVAIASEAEAGRGKAAMLESRLQYAEDKLLQQEAELVQLQGQASAARRRIKAATAATLSELLDRYGNAASQHSSADGAAGAYGSRQQTFSNPQLQHQQVLQRGLAASLDSIDSLRNSLTRQAAHPEAIYVSMWQLLSSMQQVLDDCDQQDFQWQQQQCAAAAAAAAIARYGGAAEDPLWPKVHAPSRSRSRSNVRQGQAAAAEAAEAERAVVQQLKQLLRLLQHRAEQLSELLQHSKQSATSAAAGESGLTASQVAAAAADALGRMLKILKRSGKDQRKLQQLLEDAIGAAAGAADTTAGAAYKHMTGSDSPHSSSSCSSDSTGSANSNDSSSGSRSSSSSSSNVEQHRRSKNRNKGQSTGQKWQQLQQQQARLSRLQALCTLLQEVQQASDKLAAQVTDSRKRLADISSHSKGVDSNSGGLTSHYHGLPAGAAAGITASIAAALTTFAANMRELKLLARATGKEAATTGNAAAGQPTRSHSRGRTSKHQSALSRSYTSSGLLQGQHEQLSANRISSVKPGGDKALAGTWGSTDEALGSGGAAASTLLHNRSQSSVAAADSSSPKYSNVVQHYLIGGAAAAGAGCSSPANTFEPVGNGMLGGGGSHGAAAGGGTVATEGGGLLNRSASASASMLLSPMMQQQYSSITQGAASTLSPCRETSTSFKPVLQLPGWLQPSQLIIPKEDASHIQHQAAASPRQQPPAPVLSPGQQAAPSLLLSSLSSPRQQASSLLLSPRQQSSFVAAVAGGVSLSTTSSADVVHQRLADLSRQASKISERASLLLSTNPRPSVSGHSSVAASPRAAPPPAAAVVGGVAAVMPAGVAAGVPSVSRQSSPFSAAAGALLASSKLIPGSSSAAGAAGRPSSPRGLGSVGNASSKSSLLGSSLLRTSIAGTSSAAGPPGRLSATLGLLSTALPGATGSLSAGAPPAVLSPRGGSSLLAQSPTASAGFVALPKPLLLGLSNGTSAVGTVFGSVGDSLLPRQSSAKPRLSSFENPAVVTSSSSNLTSRDSVAAGSSGIAGISSKLSSLSSKWAAVGSAGSNGGVSSPRGSSFLAAGL